jgi:hypothetical protein
MTIAVVAPVSVADVRPRATRTGSVADAAILVDRPCRTAALLACSENRGAIEVEHVQKTTALRSE